MRLTTLSWLNVVHEPRKTHMQHSYRPASSLSRSSCRCWDVALAARSATTQPLAHVPCSTPMQDTHAGHPCIKVTHLHQACPDHPAGVGMLRWQPDAPPVQPPGRWPPDATPPAHCQGLHAIQTTGHDRTANASRGVECDAFSTACMSTAPQRKTAAVLRVLSFAD